MAKLTLDDTASGYAAPTKINANNALIEAALENTLSRDGTSPNTMSANLDMNSNRVVNLASPVNNTDAARLVDIDNASSIAIAPSQTGNAGKVLLTDGTTASWSNTISAAVDVTNTTQSTSSTTGAVTTAGGVGVAKDLFVGGSCDITGVLKLSNGTDVASAAALTLGTDGNYFDITGTTAITSIGTVGVGTVVKLHFDGVLTLTHHATDLILPGGANITTAAGDEAEFIEYAAGDWRCTNYQRASVAPGPHLLAEQTVTGSAVTSIDFTGLDIATHKSYRIEVDWINPVASIAQLHMYINNNTTGTNYYRTELRTDDATRSSARSNDASIQPVQATNHSSGTINIRLDGGSNVKATNIVSDGGGSSTRLSIFNFAMTPTQTNITQITFTSDVSLAIGVGSSIRIYRGDL